jgi:hypothetical protein
MTIDMSIANGASENFKPGPKSATRMGRSNRRHLRRENISKKSSSHYINKNRKDTPSPHFGLIYKMLIS